MNIPLVFSEDDTMNLARLLVTVAKEETPTYEQRLFAAEIFIRLDSAAKATSQDAPARFPIRPNQKQQPRFSTKKGR